MAHKVGAPEPIDRPRQIATLSPDQLVAAVLRLTMEISVLRERLATHEQLLAEHGLLTPESVDAHRPDAQESARRATARTQLIESILKDLS